MAATAWQVHLCECSLAWMVHLARWCCGCAAWRRFKAFAVPSLAHQLTAACNMVAGGDDFDEVIVGWLEKQMGFKVSSCHTVLLCCSSTSSTHQCCRLANAPLPRRCGVSSSALQSVPRCAWPGWFCKALHWLAALLVTLLALPHTVAPCKAGRSVPLVSVRCAGPAVHQ